jgi:hypothetical protein
VVPAARQVAETIRVPASGQAHLTGLGQARATGLIRRSVRHGREGKYRQAGQQASRMTLGHAHHHLSRYRAAIW